jgi:hypothetical protein
MTGSPDFTSTRAYIGASMTDPKRTLDYLLQLDTRRLVEQQLGAQPWITVCGEFPERGKGDESQSEQDEAWR